MAKEKTPTIEERVKELEEKTDVDLIERIVESALCWFNRTKEIEKTLKVLDNSIQSVSRRVYDLEVGPRTVEELDKIIADNKAYAEKK